MAPLVHVALKVLVSFRREDLQDIPLPSIRWGRHHHMQVK